MLFFKGTGTLKPFVPQTPVMPPVVSDRKADVTESQMTTKQAGDAAFEFMADMLEWEANQEELDRQWYDAEEDGNIRYAEEERPQQETLELKQKKLQQPVSRRAMNTRDHDKWELNRMVTSGALKMRDQGDLELENMEAEEARVLLMVHDLKPPFLDGRETFTKQTQPVQVVRDPTSDIAALAKKGSALLKFVRERQDRSTMREKFWDI